MDIIQVTVGKATASHVISPAAFGFIGVGPCLIASAMKATLFLASLAAEKRMRFPNEVKASLELI
jgi:hypothetical protein